MKRPAFRPKEISAESTFLKVAFHTYGLVPFPSALPLPARRRRRRPRRRRLWSQWRPWRRLRDPPRGRRSGPARMMLLGCHCRRRNGWRRSRAPRLLPSVPVRGRRRLAGNESDGGDLPVCWRRCGVLLLLLLLLLFGFFHAKDEKTAVALQKQITTKTF